MRRALALLCLLVALPVWGGQIIVAKKKAGGGADPIYADEEGAGAFASDTTIATGTTMDVAVDDVVVVFASNQTSGRVAISSVTDNADTPNTYTPIAAIDDASFGTIRAFYSKITTAKTGVTITATFAAAAQYRAISAIKITGSSASPLDQSNTGTGTFQTDMSSIGSVTTTAANTVLVVATANENSNPFTISAPWTKGPAPTVPGTTEYLTTEYRKVTSTGTYSAAGTCTSQRVAGIIVAIK